MFALFYTYLFKSHFHYLTIYIFFTLLALVIFHVPTKCLQGFTCKPQHKCIEMPVLPTATLTNLKGQGSGEALCFKHSLKTLGCAAAPLNPRCFVSNRGALPNPGFVMGPKTATSPRTISWRLEAELSDPPVEPR